MIDRIRDEMADHPQDMLIQMIGDHISAYMQVHPGAEIKSGKTLKKAAEAMQQEAGKHRNGKNWAALDFVTGMRIAYEALGLPFDAAECTKIQMGLYDGGAVIPAKEPQAHAEADVFDLDALMEGL